MNAVTEEAMSGRGTRARPQSEAACRAASRLAQTDPNIWQQHNQDAYLSRAQRAAARELIARKLTGERLRSARAWLGVPARTVSDVRALMARLESLPDTIPGEILKEES